MEIFIRGLIALGIALAVATVGFSDTPAVAASGSGCVNCGGAGVGGGHLGGKFGLGGGLGHGRFAHLFDGKGGKAGAGAGDMHGPRTQPGTVVFPQHPFARSPRDYFMVD
jgi:hypothetical protein